jgi:thymidylate synthase ThyX
LKSVYVDSSRFLLPAAALANVGMTVNARILEHLISKMLSHPLAEVRNLGEEIKQVAVAEVPTLVKYANENPYLAGHEEVNHVSEPANSAADDFCRLVDYTSDGEERFLSALLYRSGLSDYDACSKQVRGMSEVDKHTLIDSALGQMGRFDYPPREAEYIFYTFDTVMDQGAYYEVKRHRMMTQSPQQLTCSLGYATPNLFRQAGFEADYRAVMADTLAVYEKVKSVAPLAAAYLVPNGFYRRVLLTMNLREAFHFIQLRSAPGAHYSVRLLAQRMAEQIRQVHPWLGTYLRVNPNETWQSVLQDNFVA